MAQILKFRLQDGYIFDFEYTKYSEFIDNLEPEPGVIIDVLEPFTLEEFETAQIEYDKYVVFKEALEDIITTRELWSKEELKELSKYDLNNPVLEWLMIRDNREDKEIKESFSLESLEILKSFEIHDIKSDNIILYYLVDIESQFAFIRACEKGHLKVAQWLYSLGNINIHIYNDDAFNWACQNGHLKVAKWLYSLGDVNIHTYNDDAFKRACQNGHLDVAQWLYSLGGVNIHSDDELLKLRLEAAQLVYSDENFNIDIYIDVVFNNVCEGGHLEMAQWLWSLGGFSKERIKTTHQPIKKWLATLE